MSVTLILEHLYIVLMCVLFSTLVGLPLGIIAYYWPPVRKAILRVVEILQIIPALAMLGMVMVIFGAGKLTVVIGLVLYSLLPIVHNTCIGLEGISPGIKEAARGVGLSKVDRLLTIELPLAFPMVFTGLRIATVTAVGVAVFATTVGGGGLGSIINRGIRIQNMQMILSGTLALVVMAILFDTVMAFVEKKLYQGADIRRTK